jgi:hypothetical protein
MANNQVEISKIEINPNYLRKHSKLPLPDFAVSALEKNGFSYASEKAGSRIFEHDLQHKDGQLKLKSHIQSINTHIDRDGPRIWNGRGDRYVGNTLNCESSNPGSSSD